MLNGDLEVLLVDDDPGDVELIQNVLEEAKAALNLQTVPDGVEAMAYLRRQGVYAEATGPDLLLLISKVYDLGLSCYVPKPVGLERFTRVVRQIENFWFTVVNLSPRVCR